LQDHKENAPNFVGVEIDELYCCLTAKRLEMAATDASIQGYADNAFWERNSLSEQKKEKCSPFEEIGMRSF
jgi:site-specific DNA-methyltransferase (adenine-specific)